jgi:hypothetical protein
MTTRERSAQLAAGMMTTDAARLNWLAARPERLREVYWRMENEGETLREAIDALTRVQIACHV